MKQQRGGTFLGFIIGLVVGLGAALAVAVYVTKVPIPFVNKGQTSRTPEQDAAEARKNRDWDPNAPLQGKNPAPKPATGATVPPGGAASDREPAAVPAKPEVKPAVSADPLGELANKAAAGAAPEPFVYFVQAGAFRAPDEAETLRAKLSLTGLEAKVSEREQSGRMVYRVRIGPLDKRDEAERVRDRLNAGGQEAVLVRAQR